MKRQILQAQVATFTDLSKPEECGEAIYLESAEYLVKLEDKTHRVGYFNAELTAGYKGSEKVDAKLAEELVGRTFAGLFAGGHIKNNSISFVFGEGAETIDIEEIESIIETSKVVFNN